MATNSTSEERPKGITARVMATLASNLRYRTLWSEISGALGDLGTFIPIAIALTLVNGLDLGTTLIATGIYNAVTGLLFGVPMPVQPMKAIAAAALAQSGSPLLSVPQIMAAGITTAALLALLGVTGLMGLVMRLVPLPVVRGIQLSQGLALANTAIKYVLKEQNFAHSKTLGSSSHPWLGLDGILLALLAFCFIVLTTGSGDGFVEMSTDHTTAAATSEDDNIFSNELALAQPSSKRAKYLKRLEAIPTAVIIVLLGIALAFARKPSILHSLSVGPSAPHIIRISRNDWKIGFLRAAIPQIPLSILNSVIAVCKLSADLFPDKAAHVSPQAVSASVGLMNLVGCWFGAMPVCHGCGGLAGQCRFGARSGAAMVFLGTGKLVTGMLFGSSLVKVLAQFPVGLLGVLLLFSGVELAMACRDQTSRADSFVMIVCTAASLGSSNAALGFASGLLLFILLHLRRRGLLPCCRILKELIRGTHNDNNNCEP